MSAAFHLCNKEARNKLNISVNGQPYPFCTEPIYIGIKLDKAFMFRRHLESLRKKITSRVGLLRQYLYQAGVRMPQYSVQATLALVHSTAQCCAPVWCRSAHTRLIDKPIKNVLRIVTGCLCLTPKDNILS